MRVKFLLKYLLRQTIRLITLLVAVSIFSFVLVSNSPIDPIQSYIGADMIVVSPEQQGNIAEYWGLNKTKTEQFVHWGTSMIKGDMGTSLIHRSPVTTIIGERFLASLLLMATAWVLSGIIGFILGIISGMKKGTWVDRIIKVYCFTLASTPTFWLGLVLLILFSVWLGWLPIGLGSPAGVLASDISFLDRMKHLLLPAITLSIVGVANIALHTREKLIDVLNSDYVRFAKAKGEKGWKLFTRHGLRNIALPAITLHFASFGELFGGTILVEQVFSYPGLGQAIVQSGLGGDIPLLMGVVICSTFFVFTGNVIADLLYKVIDPRIRKEELS